MSSYDYRDVRIASAQGVRIARQNTPGVPGTDWLVLDGLNVMPRGGPTLELDKSSGSLVPTMSTVTEDVSEGTATGKGDYNATALMMCSIFGLPTITNLGSGAYRWRFIWDGKTPVSPVEWTLDWGQNDYGSRFPGWVFSGYGFSGDQGEGYEVDAAGKGNAMSHIAPLGGITLASFTLSATGASAGTFILTAAGAATAPIAYNASAAVVRAALEAVLGLGTVTVTGSALPTGPLTITFTGPRAGMVVTLTANSTGLTGGTATVTAVDAGGDTAVIVPAVPISATSGKVWLDDNWANIKTTQLPYVYTFNLGLDDKFENVGPINRDLTSEFKADREDQEHTIEVGFGIGPTERALLPHARAGGRSYLGIDWQGPLIGGGIYYLFSVKAVLLWSEVAEPTSYRSVATRPWTATLARDSVANKCIEIDVITTLPSLSGV